MENISKRDYSIAIGLAALSVAICVVIPWLLSFAETDAAKGGYHWILWEMPIFVYLIFALYWGCRDKRLYAIVLPIITILLFMCLLPYYGFSWLNLAMTAIISAITVAVTYLLFKDIDEINEGWRVRDASYRADGITVTYPRKRTVVLVSVAVLILVLSQLREVPEPVSTWHELLYMLPMALYAICAVLWSRRRPLLFYCIGTIALWGGLVLSLYPKAGFSDNSMILSAVIAVMMAAAVAAVSWIYKWNCRSLKRRQSSRRKTK